MIELGEGHECADAATPIYTVIDKGVTAFAVSERLFHVAELLLAGGHKAEEVAQFLTFGAVVALSIGQERLIPIEPDARRAHRVFMDTPV